MKTEKCRRDVSPKRSSLHSSFKMVNRLNLYNILSIEKGSVKRVYKADNFQKLFEGTMLTLTSSTSVRTMCPFTY